MPVPDRIQDLGGFGQKEEKEHKGKIPISLLISIHRFWDSESSTHGVS